MRHRLTLADLRAAVWADRALRRARCQLGTGRVTGFVLPPPPNVPGGARRGVEALLRRRGHTCLEAAIVRQRWLAAHGMRREIVIGVASPRAGFVAHAWVDGEEPSAPQQFSELTRIR